jgi:hypothetical protein
VAELTVEVNGQLPPLKDEAKSLLSPGHGQAPRVLALVQAVHEAKGRESFEGFGGRRIGMELVLQARRVNLDLAYLGELADAFLYADDAQIREVIYREESGELGYSLRFWTL